MKKTIVIIGAGPGLGMAVAKKFGKEGFETILVARNEEALKSMKDELSELRAGSPIFVKTGAVKRCADVYAQ